MLKIQKKNRFIKNNLLDSLYNFISNDKVFSNKYIKPCKTRKFNLRTLLSIIIDVLKSGISWRFTSKLIEARYIHWNTIYKTYIKLVNDKIIHKCYSEILNTYLQKNPGKKLNMRSTDTSVVYNKLGEECVGRNKYYKNKNCTKISLICDSNGIPLDTKIYEGNKHDSTILYDQLTKENINEKCIINKYKKYMLADKGYDSNKITNILKGKGYTPIIAYNKRNTKDITKIRTMNKKEKILYKRRIIIEQIFMKLKRCKRINIRYDRKMKTYEGFVLLGVIDLIIKHI